MWNLHLQIKTEYDVESMKIFHCWKRMELKMANFQNHRRFTLRCLSEKVIPVSVRLNSQIKTPKGFQLIGRTKRTLLNERVRLINNSINMLSMQRDTCKIKLKERIGEEIMEECEMFIKTRKEVTHFKTMNRQKRKFETLCQKISSKKGGHSNTIQSGHTVKLVPGRGGHSNKNSNIISDHSDVQYRAGTQVTTTNK